MLNEQALQPVAKILIVILLVSQVLVLGNALLTPKPAQAQFVGATFTTIIADPYQAAIDAAIGIAKGIALRFADGFLTRFMDKVVEKYHIRNFVYYDQVLSDYYLTNLIRDKVSDPDLQSAFLLLDSAYVAGNNTGYSGYDPTAAIIPKLKKKINNIYVAQGGVDPNYIANPPANVSGLDYYAASYNYYLNPPSSTEQNIRSQYAAFQSAASTASELEIIVGGGYKSGRGIVTGTCTLPQGVQGPPPEDQASCASSHGTWNPSALDYARAFIDNPGQFAHDFVNTTINTLLADNFNPNDIWSAVGSLIGNFIFNKLALNSNSGVLNEGGQPYAPATPGTFWKALDIDGDGINDAYDTNNNGILDAGDVCIISGIAPNCTGSAAATTVPPTPVACSTLGQQEQALILPLLNAIPSDNPVTLPASAGYQAQVETVVNQLDAQFNPPTNQGAAYEPGSNTVGLPEFYAAGPTPTRLVSPSTGQSWDIVSRCNSVGVVSGVPPADALTKHPDQSALVTSIKANLLSQGVNLSGACGAFDITKRVAWALRADGAGLLSKPAGNNCNGFAVDIIMYPDGYIYDILGDAGGANTPGWLPDASVSPSLYTAAFDPGP